MIASRATVTVDLRSTDEATLQRAAAELAAFVQRLPEAQSVSVRTRRLVASSPCASTTVGFGWLRNTPSHGATARSA